MDANYSGYEQFLNKDIFYMRDELIKENPDIRLFVKNSLLIKDEDTFNLYKNSNLLKVDENTSISTNLLYDLIQQEGMYKYLISMLDYDDDKAINIQLYKDGVQKDVIDITKASLINAYKKLLETNPTMQLYPVVLTRIAVLFSLTSKNVCYNYYADDVYKCHIDKEEYELPIRYLLDLLTAKPAVFNELLKDCNSSVYTREIIAYMIVNFVERESIFNKYVFDDHVYERYNDLKSFKSIDYESINKLNKSDDIMGNGESILDTFDINPSLRKDILEDMDPTYNKLEQAIYIYIRLCDLLTYDDEYYASDSKFEKSGIHGEIPHISYINKEDNKVVSYEFVLIYSKLLRELGIKYSDHLNSIAGPSNQVSSLEFKHNEYLVQVDLFDDVIKNDLTNIKIGGNITGIKSINTNKITNKKFNELLYEIYSRYKDMELRKKEFRNAISKYKREYKKDKNISKKERLYTLLKLIGRKDLKGMDSVNYIVQVFENIFKDDNTISINVLGRRYEDHSRPVIIITLQDEEDYTYFLIDPNDNITNIRKCYKDEINRLLSINVINYIGNDHIEGIGDEDDIRLPKRKM